MIMHMKKPPLRNEQLKPEYNVKVTTSEEFNIRVYISADCIDVHMNIPFARYLR